MANPPYRLDAALYAAVNSARSQTTVASSFSFTYPRFTVTNHSKTKTLIGAIRPSWFAPAGPRWQAAVNQRYGFKWEGKSCMAVASDAFVANPSNVTAYGESNLSGLNVVGVSGSDVDDVVRDSDIDFLAYGTAVTTLNVAPNTSVTVDGISKDALLTFVQEPFPRLVRIPRFVVELQTADGDFMASTAITISAGYVTEDPGGVVAPSFLNITLPSVTLLPEGSKLLAYCCAVMTPFNSATSFTNYLVPWSCYVIPAVQSSGSPNSPFSYEGPAVFWDGRLAGSITANSAFQSYSDLAKQGLIPGQPVDDGLPGGGDASLVYVDRSFTGLTYLRSRLATSTGATVISDTAIARQVCCGWNPGTTVSNTALWVTSNFPGWRALEQYRLGIGTTSLIAHTGASPILPTHARILQRANNVLAIQFKPGDSIYDSLAPTTPIVIPGYILVLPRI